MQFDLILFYNFPVKSIEIPGYEGQQIAVEIPRGFGTAKLLINGQLAPAGAKKGQYLIHRNDGVQETAFFKGGFPDPIPTLMVGPQAVKLAPPIPTVQWIWAGVPLVLMGGGLFGGLLGMVATITNANIMRSDQIPVIKYILCAVVTSVAFAMFAFLAVMMYGRK